MMCYFHVIKDTNTTRCI